MNNTGIAQGTYSVSATCSNCGHTGKVSQKKGEKVPSAATCPNCGCYTFETQKYFGIKQ